MTIAS